MKEGNMWKRAITIGIVIIIINVFWRSCYCEKTDKIDIFIDTDCLVKYADSSSADPIESDVSHFVVWHNAFAEEDDGAGDVVINFPDESPFHISTFTIEPGGVFVTQVRADAAEAIYEFTTNCSSGGPGTGPKLKVGGGGP